MSAVIPKADIDWSLSHVRFVPIADMAMILKFASIVLLLPSLRHSSMKVPETVNCHKIISCIVAMIDL
jgi:hypothetical protein